MNLNQSMPYITKIELLSFESEGVNSLSEYEIV